MCGSTLAELHEADLLAMGVEKLGHRKIIMQGIRVLFDRGAGSAPAAGSAKQVQPGIAAGVEPSCAPPQPSQQCRHRRQHAGGERHGLTQEAGLR